MTQDFPGLQKQTGKLVRVSGEFFFDYQNSIHIGLYFLMIYFLFILIIAYIY